MPDLPLKTLTKTFKSSDMPDLYYNTSNPNTFLLQRMNNELLTAEEQVTELLKRVKELIGMSDPTSIQLTLYISNPLGLCVSSFKSSTSLFFQLQILSDERAKLEARRRCLCSTWPSSWKRGMPAIRPRLSS
jgi:hypothetical protein